MTDFEPMRDFFHRRQAKILTDRSAGVRLVTVREEAIRDCFAFPGTEYDAGIEIDGQHVGRISYGINPLNDRAYIYDLTIVGDSRRRGLATVVHSPGALGASARSRNRSGILEQGAQEVCRCRRRNQARYPNG